MSSLFFKLLKRYKLGIFQLLISAIIGIYIESVSAGKILFISAFLKEDSIAFLLENPLKVVIVLLGCQFTLYILQELKRSNTQEVLVYNNICNELFSDFIKPNSKLNNSHFRVSLLKVRESVFCLKKNYFLPKSLKYLKVTGRHQIKQPIKFCKIKFLPGQGCAGLCYELGTFIEKEIVKFNPKDEDRYYNDSLKHFQLPRSKAKRLNEKACSFFCFPVKYFNSDEVFGVLSIDCTERKKLRLLLEDGNVRKIEELVSHYSALFTPQNL